MTTIGTQYRGSREYLLVYSVLIEGAKNRRLVYYREIAYLLGVPSSGHHMARQVGQVLGEVSEDEHNAGRPMLSAIAVNEAGTPGEGFFKLAKRLQRLDGSASEAEFLDREQQAVYNTWNIGVGIATA